MGAGWDSGWKEVGERGEGEREQIGLWRKGEVGNTSDREGHGPGGGDGVWGGPWGLGLRQDACGDGKWGPTWEVLEIHGHFVEDQLGRLGMPSWSNDVEFPTVHDGDIANDMNGSNIAGMNQACAS
jgi:hypothetical protein